MSILFHTVGLGLASCLFITRVCLWVHMSSCLRVHVCLCMSVYVYVCLSILFSSMLVTHMGLNYLIHMCFWVMWVRKSPYLATCNLKYCQPHGMLWHHITALETRSKQQILLTRVPLLIQEKWIFSSPPGLTWTAGIQQQRLLAKALAGFFIKTYLGQNPPNETQTIQRSKVTSCRLWQRPVTS